MENSNFIAFIILSILQVNGKEIENNIVSAVTKFCLDKERENFCSDEHLQMMLNYAALQGKVRPIQNLKELELVRQKEIENQRLYEEKEKNRRLKLKNEREKQRQLYFQRKKEEEHRKMEALERKILNHILKDFENKLKLYFRF